MSPTLQAILDHKKTEIQALYSKGLNVLQTLAAQAPDKPSFFKALSEPGLNLIAEVKKASPSKGIIRHDFDPVALAIEFEQNGASAISVLTDEAFFQGHNDYLTQISKAVSLPILRKEFILDPIQVYEAKAIGASAILLIQAALTFDQAQTLLTLANELGLDVLLEVHTHSEWTTAQSLTGQFCVGVNNRDLTTFKIDMTQSIVLYNDIRATVGQGVPIVAESGYDSVAALESLGKMGFNAVLIGEGLAKNSELVDFFKGKS